MSSNIELIILKNQNKIIYPIPKITDIDGTKPTNNIGIKGFSANFILHPVITLVRTFSR